MYGFFEDSNWVYNLLRYTFFVHYGYRYIETNSMLSNVYWIFREKGAGYNEAVIFEWYKDKYNE